MARRPSPHAFRPRVRELDAVVRRQQVEIESLRVQLTLSEADADPWRREDLSLKLARVLRVWRLRFVKPHSPLWRGAAALSLLADTILARERARATSFGGEARAGAGGPASALAQLLNLDPYLAWCAKTEPRLRQALEREAPAGTSGPLISVVLPVYRVAPHLLRATLESLRAQTYTHWEACIAFAAAPEDGALAAVLDRYARRDRRFRVARLSGNFGIAGNSNQALERVRGDFVALLDHDDILAATAFASVAAAIRARPDADFLYTDKDLVSEDGVRRFSPLLKPEWSPETLYSVNYLTHLNVIRTDLIRAIGGWAKGVDGAQDWDLFLRATERAKAIVRVPGVAYSWRVHAGSTSTGLGAKPYALEAQLRALNRHAGRICLPGVFERHPDADYRIAWNGAPRCRVVVLGGREVRSLAGLVQHLGRERKDFTQVDLLLPPQDGWAFLKTWRARGRRLPAWCRVHHLVGQDPVAACAALLADAPEAVTLFVDGGLLVHTPGALAQLAGWLHGDGPIAFASGVTVESDERVIEAGCVRDEAGVAHPLFHGEHLRRWGVMGGPLWHRNVETASPYLLALRTRDVVGALRVAGGCDWRTALQDACLAAVAARDGGRGVVDPTARAIVSKAGVFAPPAEAMIGRPGRYLHPYLTITPQQGIVFRDEVDDAA